MWILPMVILFPLRPVMIIIPTIPPTLRIQQDDKVYRVSTDEAIIEKGLYWIVLVLRVVGIADKEVNTHEGAMT